MRHGFTQTPVQILKIPDTDQNTIQNNTHKVLLHDKFWVCATKIIELIFFSKTVSSEKYTYKLLHYFF